MSTGMHALVGRRRTKRAHASAPTTDAQLLAEVAAGADDALRELYARHGQLVYAVVRRVCGAAAAHSVTSAVFVQLWNDPASFPCVGASVRRSLLASALESVTSTGSNSRAIALVTVGGCTYAEAAAILGCAPAELSAEVAQTFLV